MSVDRVHGMSIQWQYYLAITKNGKVLYALKRKELQNVFLSEKTRCRQQV